MRRILQIVPTLPPAINGVGDHALLLAEQLRSAHDIHTSFVVADPRWPAGEKINGFRVTHLHSRDAGFLTRCLSDDPMPVVLLHYVGYGYARRGAPLWLLRSVRSALTRCPTPKLVTMFHELFATSSPWQSAFWMGPFQRFIAARLARISTAALTSANIYAAWLNGCRAPGAPPVHRLPVFSNFGELPEPLVHDPRPGRILVPGRHRASGEPEQTALTRLVATMEAEELIVLGEGNDLALPVPVKHFSRLPADRCTGLLRTCRAAFLDYFPGRLAKSSWFAGCAANGLPVVMPDNSGSDADGCRAGEHYLALTQITSGCRRTGGALHPDQLFHPVAAGARSWYAGHDLARTARLYAQIIEEVCG